MPPSNPHTSQYNGDFIGVRSRMDTTTPGEAVVTRVLTAGGLEQNYTGVDRGTGEVTISIPRKFSSAKRFSSVDVNEYGIVVGGVEGDTTGDFILNQTTIRQLGFSVQQGDITTLVASQATVGTLQVSNLTLTAPLTIQQGGTGVTQVAPHNVLIGGLNLGAPTWRVLTELDLPEISFSKIVDLPTSLSGYGIANAWTKQESDARYLQSYNLPIASSTILGGVRVGQNLNIDAQGVLSAVQQGSTDAILNQTMQTQVASFRIQNTGYAGSFITNRQSNSESALLFDRIHARKYSGANFSFAELNSQNAYGGEVLVGTVIASDVVMLAVGPNWIRQDSWINDLGTVVTRPERRVKVFANLEYQGGLFLLSSTYSNTNDLLYRSNQHLFWQNKQLAYKFNVGQNLIYDPASETLHLSQTPSFQSISVAQTILPDDVTRKDYVDSTIGIRQRESFNVVADGQTVYVLGAVPRANSEVVLVNGLEIHWNNYNLSGTTLTFYQANYLKQNDTVVVRYIV